MTKPKAVDDRIDNLPISLRSFAVRSVRDAGGFLHRKKRVPKANVIPVPSPWTLVFDTETTTDAGQAFRIGTYQIRDNGILRETGIMWEPRTVSAHEFKILNFYAQAHQLTLLTRAEFVDKILYPYGYELRATIAGFNLPFDFSRIAIGHASARGAMRGGFSFRFSADKRKPAVQIQNLSQKASLIRFAAPFKARSSRSARKRGGAPVRRGFFVDCKTLAAAQFAKSFSLKSLSEFLKVEHQKLSTDEYGAPITADFIDYAVRDVQTTWECYQELCRRYELLGLNDTRPHQIFSEASIGKAYLKAMNVRPWREEQWDVPAALLAKIMASYFGGRSEVRIRRDLRQVILCDFLSMYPTVCTLMGLWRYVIAEGTSWQDGTDQFRRFLDAITVGDLQKPDIWKSLTTLVRIQPDWNILPVRAAYGEDSQATIGANHLKVDEPLWVTLADCMASKISDGRTPKVIEALIFLPGKPQSHLLPVAIAGNRDYLVDPIKSDFYKRLIELRNEVKAKRDKTNEPAGGALDTEQNALKIAANATSYGIFVEVNVKEHAERNEVTVHSSTSGPYVVETAKDETVGRYFHPLLAALITGAARLMLAIAERLVADHHLEWVFCDTDSIAIAKPANIDEAKFHSKVDEIVAWFSALNPYDFAGSILKIENVNFGLKSPKVREPLFCWAISAKRYALFNLDNGGRPILRKASAHGLGHVRAPYDATNPAKNIPPPMVKPNKIGVELWQHDLWWKIITAALAGQPDQVDLSYHPALNKPAISRYAATTPKLLRWFNEFNRDCSYERQVKPFGFLYSLFAQTFSAAVDDHILTRKPRPARRRFQERCKPVAPYDRDLAKAVKRCFDRETRLPIARRALKSFKDVIRLYALHPESKFLNGDYLDRGVTHRRYIHAVSVRNIGKEANEWEEQFYLGFDEEDQIDYGQAPRISNVVLGRLRRRIIATGQRKTARESGLARRTVERLMKGKKLRSSTLGRIRRAVAELEKRR